MNNIYAKPGTVVRFLNENGYDRELDEARRVLKDIPILTVKHIDVGGWVSYVTFEEIEGEFNTVMFEEVEE
jgi:hypothetical protein